MCAVVGMFPSASNTPLCAIPPFSFARKAAASFATAMKVGLGFSGSCSVLSDTRPNRPRLARNEIALSSVCITRKMTVRSDHPTGHRVRRNVIGCRMTLPSHLSGRVNRVPWPVSTV
jgi:hypothetical protein